MNMMYQVTFCVLLLAVSVAGHGRLLLPASRASAHRLGFSTPADYNDNQLFCGGMQRQWNTNGGKCGTCGDPYDGAREHEAGGRFASGQILTTYNQGQTIQAKIDITANHKGWFEFRICPNNDVTKAVSQECLDQNLLEMADGSGTRFTVTSSMKEVNIDLKLPEGLTCTQCVFQWRWKTGNNWGVDPVTGQGCSGCGAQESYQGCSDVAVVARAGGPAPGPAPGTPSPPGPGTNPPVTGACRVAAGPWAEVAGMDDWCRDEYPTFQNKMCECN